MGGYLISGTKRTKIIFALLSVLGTTLASPLSAFATNTWTRYQNYKIRLDVPEGWRIERDLYGMPITVLGPMRNGERAVLNVQHTQIYGMEFDHDLLKKTLKQYYNGRHEWIDQQEDAKYMSDLPYRRLKWKNGNDGFETGFRYRMRGLDFEEKSVQINCGQRMYFVKTLSSNKIAAADRAVLSKLVNEIDCANTTAADGAYKPSGLQDYARKFRDQMEPSPWPTREQIKNMSVDSRVAIVAAMVEFYKEFDEAGGQDEFAANAPKKEGKAYALIKDRMDRMFSSIYGTAYAKEVYDCFFGGWPSKIKNGSCRYPWETNATYEKSKDSCGEGQLACNPSLFGSNVCIFIDSAQARSHATLRCEAEFRQKKRTFDDVVKEEGFDQNLLDESIESARSVCSEEPYASSNYGLCSTLKEKLDLAINVGKHTKDESDDNFLNGMEAMKPEDYEAAVDAFMINYADFEGRCIDGKGALKIDVENCAEDNNRILDDMEKLEKAGASIQKELEGQEEQPDLKNKNCEGADCTATPPTENAFTNQKPEVEVVEGGSCTEEENKNKAGGVWDCTKKTVKSLVLHPLDSLWSGLKCAGNLLLSVVDSLWSTVKAIGNLIWDGVTWVGGKLKQAWNWLTNSKEVEDATATKAQIAAQTDNSVIKQFMDDPRGAGAKFFAAVMDGVNDYFRNDAFCQEWSAVPHLSTCTKSANWDCISCEGILQGSCSTLGFIIGEVAPAILTWGGTAAIKGIGVAAKVSSWMSKASKLGKLVKFEKQFAKLSKAGKYTRQSGMVSDMVKAGAGISGKLSKTQKIIGKLNNVARWPLKKLNKIKHFFAKGSKKLKDFASPKFGSLKNTKKTLVSYRNKYSVLKGGSWVVREVVGGVKHLTKGIYKLVTLPIRAPAKLYVWAQRTGTKVGFKYGERWFNKRLVNSSKMTRLRDVASAQKWVLRSQITADIYKGVMHHRKLNQVDFASDEQIRDQAKLEGKTEKQIRETLQIAHAAKFSKDAIFNDIILGKEPQQKDINTLAKLTDQNSEQVMDGVYDEVILDKINEFEKTGDEPTFSEAEYQAHAKTHQKTLQQSKDEIIEMIIPLRIKTINQGRTVSISEEEYASYARVRGISTDEAKTEIAKTIKETQYKFENGIVDDSELPPVSQEQIKHEN